LRWPYPYRAALALSNDTDGMFPGALADLHDFVNGTEETPYGEGCGLEMGDSFWVWCEHNQLSLRHGVPSDASLPASPEADLLRQLAQAGWLDTLHGFGAWSTIWRMDRSAVERGLELLDALGMRPSVYVNHGGSKPLPGGDGRTMSHNFGGPWGWYQRADDTRDQSYCLDLLHQAGFRFFWSDVCFELTKFGEDRTFRNQRWLDREVAGHDFGRWFRRRPAEGDGPFEHAFPHLDEAEILALRERFFNRLVFPVTARDGREVLCFKRFRGLEGPTAGNFAAQVTARNLDELESREAGVIVYQHFGVWRPLGAGRNEGIERLSEPPVLDVHGTWAFRHLAERQRAGRILVTTPSRLLRFAWARDNLDWLSESQGDALVLRLRAVRCPAHGNQPLDTETLQGMSFKVPKGTGDVRLDVPTMSAPPRLHRTPHPEDETADVVYVPWTRLTWHPISPVLAKMEQSTNPPKRPFTSTSDETMRERLGRLDARN
jgi:hypothetical protein